MRCRGKPLGCNGWTSTDGFCSGNPRHERSRIGRIRAGRSPGGPPRPQGPAATGQPLPRLWKTEPDEDEEEPTAKAKSSQGKEDSPPVAKIGQARGGKAARDGSKSKPAARSSEKDGERTKVLVEETPALDTYEARQRGRLIMGGLFAACFLIFGWIVYRSSSTTPTRSTSRPTTIRPRASARRCRSATSTSRPAPCSTGRTRAPRRDAPSRPSTLLQNVVKVYKGTKTAADAKEALDRPGQNLPLFLDRPAVKADAAPPSRSRAPAGPSRGRHRRAQAGRGQRHADPAGQPRRAHAEPALAAGHGQRRRTSANKVPARARPLPPGFTAKTEAGIHPPAGPWRSSATATAPRWCSCRAAPSPWATTAARPRKAPAHKVRLSPYYIDQHEVTVRQFRLFLKETHYRGQPPRSWSEDFQQEPVRRIPMVMVNARDAQAYADWAQKKLPTEAQWEMAARSHRRPALPLGPRPDHATPSPARPGRSSP